MIIEGVWYKQKRKQGLRMYFKELSGKETLGGSWQVMAGGGGGRAFTNHPSVDVFFIAPSY